MIINLAERRKPVVVEEPIVSAKDEASAFIAQNLLPWAQKMKINIEDPQVKQLCAGITSNLRVMLDVYKT